MNLALFIESHLVSLFLSIIPTLTERPAATNHELPTWMQTANQQRAQLQQQFGTVSHNNNNNNNNFGGWRQSSSRIPISNNNNNNAQRPATPRTPYDYAIYDEMLLSKGDVSSGRGGIQNRNHFGTHQTSRGFPDSSRGNTRSGISLLSPSDSDGASVSEHWCYHCASPRTHAKAEHLEAMDQLMDLRFAQYPSSAVYTECDRMMNRTAVQKQRCRHDYCYTIKIGKAFTGQLPLTIRGCAENFVAINEEVFKDGFCRDLPSRHKLPIKECVCRGRSVCSEHIVERRSNNPNSSISRFRAIDMIMICGTILIGFVLRGGL